MVFRWRLSDSKSPQVSRTLLTILAVLNNAVVWMVSTRPTASKSSSPFSTTNLKQAGRVEYIFKFEENPCRQRVSWKSDCNTPALELWEK